MTYFSDSLLEHAVTLGGMKSSGTLIVNAAAGDLPEALAQPEECTGRQQLVTASAGG